MGVSWKPKNKRLELSKAVHTLEKKKKVQPVKEGSSSYRLSFSPIHFLKKFFNSATITDCGDENIWWFNVLICFWRWIQDLEMKGQYCQGSRLIPQRSNVTCHIVEGGGKCNLLQKPRALDWQLGQHKN